jgi:hypothetical protein
MMQQNAYVTKYDLEEDIRKNPELVAKIKSRDDYAQNLYAAMCNMRWQRTETFPILKNDIWNVSWRSAGGIVAELRGDGDYLDWYCSGMIGWGNGCGELNPKFVPESVVTLEILNDLKHLGWHPVPWED